LGGGSKTTDVFFAYYRRLYDNNEGWGGKDGRGRYQGQQMLLILALVGGDD
jgi:hypothetical protein